MHLELLQNSIILYIFANTIENGKGDIVPMRLPAGLYVTLIGQETVNPFASSFSGSSGGVQCQPFNSYNQMTTEQNYVGKASYATTTSQTVNSDLTGYPVPDIADALSHRFTPKFYQVPLALGKPLSNLSLLLEALFCYQSHLGTLPQSDNLTGLSEILDVLIANALDATQQTLSNSVFNIKKGGVSHAV